MKIDRRPLQRHQHQACRVIRKHKGKGLILLAPGTGKTLVGIRTAVTPVLVICRRDDMLTWKIELEDEGVPEEDMTFIDAGDAEIIMNKWVFITYDLVRNPRLYAWIKDTLFKTCIADEVHMLAHWEAARTKSCIRATRHIPRRVGLTGTAIGNNIEDVWSQCLFVDNGATFNDNKWVFLNRYFVQDNYRKWHPQRGAKDRIRDRMKRIAFAVEEDDVLKLPPVRRFMKGIPMKPKQLEMYESVLKAWEAELEDGRYMEIRYVIQQMQKLRQVANGFMYLGEKDEERETYWITDHKYREVLRFIKDHPLFSSKDKIVIWCSHRAEIEKYMELTAGTFDIPALEFHGSLSRKQREAARLAFRDDPYYRLFIAQVDAGVGMNELIVADTAFYHSNSMKARAKKQSMARTRRIGSEHHEFCYYVEWVTEKSIELKLLRTVQRSIDLAHYIMEGLKEGKNLRKLLSDA